MLLIGLASKNAILIAEFARELRSQGRPIMEAAMDAARLRFRAILMTSFAFILGVIPLVVAEGAGAGSRRAIGNVVFGGMVSAVIIGVFLIPVLYVIIQGLVEGSWRKRRGDDTDTEPDGIPEPEPQASA